MYKKLKSYLGNDANFMSSLLFGVGIMSFGLGRLSVEGGPIQEGSQSQIALISSALPTPQATTSATSSVPLTLTVTKPVPESAPYVGSKSGTKYHLTTCAGAKRIKPENQIYFNTPKEAEAAGYSKAANCPGL